MTDRIDELLVQMTLEEKVSLLSGEDFWSVPAIERLGIGKLRVTDGPNGARGGGSLFGGVTAAAFPVGIAIGATWDPALAEEIGAAIADADDPCEVVEGAIPALVIGDLTHADDGITGTLTLPRGDTTEVKDATFVDGVLSFAVELGMGQRSMTQRFEGTLKDGTITGEMQRDGGPAMGGRGGAAGGQRRGGGQGQGQGPGPRTFTMVRAGG